MFAGKYIQQQVTVSSVVTVIKAPLLLAVNGKVGGIDVQHDLLWRFCLRLHKHIH